MTPDQFTSYIKDKKVLAEFKAPWCAPCRAQAPLVRALCRRYGSAAQYLEINIDDEPAVATRYMVQSIPTLILFDHGREVKRLVGLQTEAVAVRALDPILTPNRKETAHVDTHA